MGAYIVRVASWDIFYHGYIRIVYIRPLAKAIFARTMVARARTLRALLNPQQNVDNDFVPWAVSHGCIDFDGIPVFLGRLSALHVCKITQRHALIPPS